MKEKLNKRYLLKIFPPIGLGEKFYFENINELALFIKKTYDKFIIKVDEFGEPLSKEKRSLEYFCDQVQLTVIDKDKCPKHELLFK